jgi:hypothetical protein
MFRDEPKFPNAAAWNQKGKDLYTKYTEKTNAKKWEDLTDDLYSELKQICLEAYVVLIINNFETVAETKFGQWLITSFLTKVRKNIDRNRNLVVVIAGDSGLTHLKLWDGVEYIDVVNDMDIEDIQKMAEEDFHFKITKQAAQEFKEDSHGNMEDLKARLKAGKVIYVMMGGSQDA